MKGSERKVLFSSAASSKGSDENDGSNQEMGLNLENPKKQTKNFMSPTVSTATKATFPRKKILAERNESPGSNFSNTHLSKTPNLDSKASPKTIPKASHKNSPNLDPKVPSKEPSSQKTPSSYNSRDETPSPRPYDPLTNYLSPRPQFLRYNPSRRKEIFFRLEMEEREGDDGLSVTSPSSFYSKKSDGDEADIVSSDNPSLPCSSHEDEEFGDESGSLLELEDEEFDIESDEEAEEEVGWSLRRVLKYLLLVVVLVQTTSYISSMNSPTSARASEGLTLGYQKIQNYSFGIVEGVEGGYKFLDEKKEQLGLLGLNQAILDMGIEEEMTENVNKGEIVSLQLQDVNVASVEMIEEVKKDGKSEDACEEELIESGGGSDQYAEDVDLQEKETVEKIEEVEKADGVMQYGESEDVIENELLKTEKVSNQLVEDIDLQERDETAEQTEDAEEVEDVKENGESQDVIEEELVETGKVSYQIVGDIELLGQETAGEIEFLQGDQASLLSEGNDHQEAASHTTDSSEKERVVPKKAGEEIHNETSENDMVQPKLIRFGNARSMASAVTMLERWINQQNFEEVNPLKGINRHMETEILIKVMFGFLTCAVIVASLVLGSNIRRKRSMHSSLVDKHSTRPVQKEEPNLVIPAEREKHKTHVTKLLISSVDKDIKETYQRRAPSVELLGEFEVGGINSSLQSCAIKSRMKDEVSSYSDFQEKGLESKAYSTPSRDQQFVSELSIVNSNSSERLTAKKKLSRKEFGNNDMVGADAERRNNMVTTPLRRSARIRNRADAASP